MKMHSQGYDQRKELGNKCAKAVDLFIKSVQERFPDSEQNKSLTRKDVWALIVIEKTDRNIGDQKMLEAALYFDHGIKSMRMSLPEIQENGCVDKETGNLYVDGQLIGFVYYRSGYDEK